MNHLFRGKSLTRGNCKLWLVLCILILVTSCGSGSPGLNCYTQAVGAADEGAAIQTIRTIATAQEQYRATHGDYGSFDTLTKAGILDARFAGDAPTLRGYRFTMNVDSSSFTINADPQATANQPAIGSHHYYFDSKDGITRANSKQAASASDPPQQQQQ